VNADSSVPFFAEGHSTLSIHITCGPAANTILNAEVPCFLLVS